MLTLVLRFFSMHARCIALDLATVWWNTSMTRTEFSLNGPLIVLFKRLVYYLQQYEKTLIKKAKRLLRTTKIWNKPAAYWNEYHIVKLHSSCKLASWWVHPLVTVPTTMHLNVLHMSGKLSQQVNLENSCSVSFLARATTVSLSFSFFSPLSSFFLFSF